VEIAGYIASLFIGITLGLLGGGGSILTIPILVYLFQLDAITASAYSLFIVGVTSLTGAVSKYREHLVNLRTGFLFGVPSIVSIFVTRKWIVPSIPEVLFTIESFVFTKRTLLLGLFALLMILASVSMIHGRKEVPADQARVRVGSNVLEGSLIGILTGLVGAGGGFLIIPALVLLTGLPFKTAVGTSLFVIAINSMIGFLGDILNHSVIDWNFLIRITTLAVAGILLGNLFSKYISALRLRKSFGWLTLAMGCWIIFKEFLHANS
jgi:uncharacterized protein